jgi:hypothetical protein
MALIVGINCAFDQEAGYRAFRTLCQNMKLESAKRFLLDKQLSDIIWAFIKFAKAEFCKQAPIQQCCVHFTDILHFFQI